jgi:LPXTG-motif cell wall-anchored protein
MTSASKANPSPGFSAGWEIIGPAWPLYAAALIFSLAGWYFWRKRSKPDAV